MRYIYTFLFYLALPFVFIRLLWRSLRLPSYRERLGERLGFYPFKLEKCIWVHAVSVGETIAAIPLIKKLMMQYPDLPILVTTMTPTGAARVKTVFLDQVYHLYLPYDLPGAVNRFLTAMRPVIAIMMETELWPNLLHGCQKKKIPVCLMNARLSEKSAKGYGQISRLTKNMLRDIDVIAAHSGTDADRFIRLGAKKEHVMVTGNLKFDLELPPSLLSQSKVLRETLGPDRFIWIAASTHEGEEEIVLAAHKKIKEKNPQALLILVPRHPDRFDAVAKLCKQHFKMQRRNDKQTMTSDTSVYLGDTMGELLLMYAAADVTFVAGSLISRGGHNILEPAALGKAILTGPSLFNFAEISEFFSSANALLKVSCADTLAAKVIYLMQNPQERQSMGERARTVVNANRGALLKQFSVIESFLPA